MKNLITAIVVAVVVAGLVGLVGLVGPMAILMATVSPVVLPGTWWIAVVVAMVYAAIAGVYVYRMV